MTTRGYQNQKGDWVTGPPPADGSGVTPGLQPEIVIYPAGVSTLRYLTGELRRLSEEYHELRPLQGTYRTPVEQARDNLLSYLDGLMGKP